MPVLRTDYFNAGLAALSDGGHTNLKLAEVCRRLGVTTGSFYHFFPNWDRYVYELIEHWKTVSTTALIASVERESDPRRRIDRLIHIGLQLDHRAEAAMRAWATANPAVLAVHVEIDELRYGILRDSAAAIVDDDARADRFARWAIYVLIGYEQCTLPTDITALGWIGGQLTRSLEPGSDVAITAAGRKEST